ncbi:MAG: hypothetical protein IKO60_01025, partial [Bacteroidaceae bacterium]|nr:hypothetical protein [Bacteroidaceae bacterium]
MLEMSLSPMASCRMSFTKSNFRGIVSSTTVVSGLLRSSNSRRICSSWPVSGIGRMESISARSNTSWTESGRLMGQSKTASKVEYILLPMNWNTTLVLHSMGSRARVSHSTDPVTVKVIDEASILRDMRLMKEASVNYIRTSHYPREP